MYKSKNQLVKKIRYKDKKFRPPKCTYIYIYIYIYINYIYIYFAGLDRADFFTWILRMLLVGLQVEDQESRKKEPAAKRVTD